MCPRWSPTTISRWWPEFGFSILTSAIRGWLLGFDFSYFTTRWSSFRLFELWIIDDVLWNFVTILESVALSAMLCYFFVFCGCTV